MNRRELEELVAQGESTTLELKSTTGQRSEAARTVCAMLGTRGGFVVFGVKPNGTISGQAVGERTLEEVSGELRRIEPPAFPDVETVDWEEGRQVVVVRVPFGGGPYLYDGRPYYRQGRTTGVMPQVEYERRLFERNHGTTRWENQPAVVGLDDLDATEIVRTVEEAIRRGRMEDPGTRDPWLLLQGLRLIEGGKILNAAVVLFARADHLLPRYPQCLLRMARFRGNSLTADFEDNRQEHGNLFDLLQRGQRFLRDHLPIAGRVLPSLFERVDDPLYPPTALREALANALCHRDYGVGSGSVSLAIYDDRLEVKSTGPLPFGQSVEDLRRPHQSRPWNPLVAQTLYRRGVIESWGRGTLKIIDQMEEAGLEPPEFEDRFGEVTVRFRPTRYVPPTRVAHELTDLQRQILETLHRLGPCSLKRIGEDLGVDISRRTLQDNLQFLRNTDLADLLGSKGGSARWSLKGVPR